jgi:hypothetical protein
MSEKQKPPHGIVAVFITPEGRVIAHAASFEPGAPAGFSQQEFQTIRARRSLSLETVRALSGDDIGNAIDEHTAGRITETLLSKGFKQHFIPIGYDE